MGVGVGRQGVKWSENVERFRGQSPGTGSEGVRRRARGKEAILPSSCPSPTPRLPWSWLMQSGGAQPSSQWQCLLLSQT